MTTAEAIKIVENYGALWQYPGLLETVQGMYESSRAGTLLSDEETAFHIVYNGLTEIFNVAE
jgi:hypothetical protein